MAKDIGAAVSRRLAGTIRRHAAKTSGRTASEGVATFIRKDPNGTCWVRLPGADADTPANGGILATAEPGQTVRYRIDGNRLTVTGNQSDPAIGMGGVSGAIGQATDTVTTLLNRTIGSVTSVIMATADGIMSVVSTKVGDSEVISKINQSPEEVTINASRVNIEGAAIFTSGRLSEGSLDAEYGGDNLLHNSSWSAASDVIESDDPDAPDGGWYVQPGADVNFNSGNGLLYVSTNEIGVSTYGMYQRVAVEPGTKYVISAEVSGTPYISIGAAAGTASVATWQTASDGRRWHTYTTGSSQQYAFVYIYCTALTTAYANRLKLERGSTPTPWSENPGDTSATSAAEQRIYYRTSSPTRPTAPTAWVTESGDRWSANSTTPSNWTTKASPLTQSSSTSGTVTRYPYLWTCMQRKAIDGTVSCSAVLLYDASTVIDGASIITGTVTADQMAANTITIGNIDTSDADTAARLNRPTWGYCNSTVSGYDTWFAVEADGFELIDGSEIAVYFDGISHSNYYFELDVNDTGHKPVVVNGVASGEGMGHIAFSAGATLTFRYVGNAYWLIDRAGTIDGTCDTPASAALKYVTVGGPFLIVEGTVLNVHCSTGNTYASGAIYLDVGGAASMPVCVDGSQTSSSNTMTWSASSSSKLTLTFVSRGWQWEFVGRSDSSETATNYITADSSGISIHDANDPSNYIRQTASGTSVYHNGESVAFWGSSARIGTTSGPHMELDSDEMTLYGEDGYTAGFSVKQSIGDYEDMTANIGIAGGSDTDTLNGPRISSYYDPYSARKASTISVESGSADSDSSAHTGMLAERRWTTSSSSADRAKLDLDVTRGGRSPVAKLDVLSGTNESYVYLTATDSTSEFKVSAEKIIIDADKWLEALGGYKAKTALTLNSACESYGTTQAPYYEKRAGMVIVSGAVKPKSQVASGGSMTIATLPSGYRPIQRLATLCQGSTNYIWLLEIATDGVMTASRYRQGNTNAAMDTSTWLPFHVVFPTQ